MATHTWRVDGIASYIDVLNRSFKSGAIKSGSSGRAWFGALMPGDKNTRYLNPNIRAILSFDTSKYPSSADLKYKKNIKLRLHATIVRGYTNAKTNGYANYLEVGVTRYIRCHMGYSPVSANSLANMSADQFDNINNRYFLATDKVISKTQEYIEFDYDDYIDEARKNCTYFVFEQAVSGGNYYGGVFDSGGEIWLQLTYDDVIPTAKMTTPIEGTEFNKSQPVTFKWNYSEAKEVGQKSFSIKYTTGGKTKTVTQTTPNHYYRFPENTFDDGTVTYYLTVTNNDGQSSTSGPYTATCVPSKPSVTASYPVNTGVQKSQPFTLAWKFSETANTGQKEYTIEITQNGETEIIYGNGDGTEYTFPHYKFTDGPVTYYLTVTNNDGQSSTSGPYTFNIISSVPVISGVYPIDVLVKKSEEFTLAWNYRETVSVGQIQYWLYITQSGVTTEYSEISSKHYHTIAANTLLNGDCSYTIKVLNNDGQSSTSGPYTFTVVGDSDAPNIIEVTNDARPTITWEIDSQDAFEIVVNDSEGNKVYESELIVDQWARNFQIDTLLKNGDYIVNIRALNIYGYYTPWGSHYITINAQCKSAISKVYAFLTNEYGISIDCEITGGQAYVIRKKQNAEEIEVIGEYTEGFVDYTIPLNEHYQYAIRLYDEGIADSMWRAANIKTKEVIIRDFRNLSNFVRLWISEDNIFDIRKEDSRNKSLIKCLGRTYPIKEMGEWISCTRSFNAYVTDEQYDALIDMEVNGTCVGYQATGEYMTCDIDITDGGKYLDEGRNVVITLTRIDS